jgi:hypothetical protein
MDKKPHKFFERHLDNNLNDLYDYLLNKKEEIKNGLVPGIDLNNAPVHYFENHNPQRVDFMFNIFQFYNESIYNLYLALSDMTKEACEYYGIDFKKEKFMIHGWFNCEDGKKEIDLENKYVYHDHSGGTGVPYFHGYYCVKAEPSTTYYKINRETKFENINIDNRAVLSETGHPHAIGIWDKPEQRITIAYDITPLSLISGGGYAEQSWIPLT